MKASLNKAINLGLVLAAFVLAGALYSRLPDMVPTHWNASGTADGFTPKPWGAFVLPLTMLGTYVVLLVLPAISPRGYGFARFAGTYETFQSAILGFLLLITAAGLIAASGVRLAMDRVVYAAVGLLFIVLGNVMGKVRKNFFVGIRTPWTLASDEVWLRTHRLGGVLFVLGGLVLLVGGLAMGGPGWVLGVVTAVGLVPALYSYWLYRKLEGFK
jgi:uncharacterized membrane protein